MSGASGGGGFGERFLNAYGAGEKEQRADVVRANAYGAVQGDQTARQAVYGADPQAGFNVDTHFAQMQEAQHQQHERGLARTREILYPLTQAKPEDFAAMLPQAQEAARAAGIPETTIAMIKTPEDAQRAWGSFQTYEQAMGQKKLEFDQASTNRKLKEDELTGAATREHLRGQSERDRAYADSLGASNFTPQAINLTVDQLLAGQTSALQNIGRGAQGSRNIALIRNRLAEVAEERNISGAQLAAATAELQGYGAAMRTSSTRGANAQMAGEEFLGVQQRVYQAINDVPATQLTDVNAIINAWNTRTGDPGIIRLGGALNAAVNTYARGISPTGVPTVHDKEEGVKIIATWMAKGQMEAALDQMQQEIQAAIDSPPEVRQRLHDEFMRANGVATTPHETKTPHLGDIVDGYKFMGGFAGDKKNWQKVQ